MLDSTNNAEGLLLNSAGADLPAATIRSRSVYWASLVSLFSCVLFLAGSAFFYPTLVTKIWCQTTGISLYLAGFVLFVLAGAPTTIKFVRDFLDGRPYNPAHRGCSWRDHIDVITGTTGILFVTGTALMYRQFTADTSVMNYINAAAITVYGTVMIWGTYLNIRTTPRNWTMITLLLTYDVGIVSFCMTALVSATNVWTFVCLVLGSSFFVLGSFLNVARAA